MLQTYYIADRVGTCSLGFYELTAIFLGARKCDDGWLATFLYASAEHSCARQEYLLRPGDTMRFARDWSMRVDKNDAGKKTDRKVSEFRISSVEPDALTVEIFPE